MPISDAGSSISVDDGGGSLTVDGTVSVTGTVSVSAASLPLPSGASTAANQSTIIGHVDGIETLLGTIDADTSVLAGAVSGSEMQVDVVSSALPTGAATEATLSALASEDFATETTLALIESSVDGVEALLTTIDADTGALAGCVSGSEVQVDIVSMPSVTVSETLDVVDFIDTTPVLDTSSTNIPASASSPLEIVASLAANTRKIKVNDTTGEFIGLYTGAPASEVLQCIIGPGEDGILPVQLASGDRVSLRNMANASISVGSLAIQFVG